MPGVDESGLLEADEGLNVDAIWALLGRVDAIVALLGSVDVICALLGRLRATLPRESERRT